MSFYKHDVVSFTHRGRTIHIEVMEVRRGCVRGFECDEKGIRRLPAKRWRKKVNEVKGVGQ